MRFFCFGWGYSVGYLARLLEGWELSGTVRTAEKAERLKKQGVQIYIYGGDGVTQEIADAVLSADVVLSSVPPVGGEDVVVRDFCDVLAQLSPQVWVGYLSTTGVYGDHQGGWVTEATPPSPSGERGAARVSAEAAWSRYRAHIFRIAGIYGTGRNALESVRQGNARRIVKPNHVFSRIHVEDLAAVVAASINTPNPEAIYNVCDDEAAPPQDVIEYACELLQCEPPPEIPITQADLSPMAQSFYGDNKRVSNEKIKSELRIRLQYPNYRVGLQALLRQLQANRSHYDG